MDRGNIHLTASKGNLSFNIGAEVLDGGQPITFSIRIGNSDS
jgi:hypothetical protein